MLSTYDSFSGPTCLLEGLGPNNSSPQRQIARDHRTRKPVPVRAVSSDACSSGAIAGALGPGSVRGERIQRVITLLCAGRERFKELLVRGFATSRKDDATMCEVSIFIRGSESKQQLATTTRARDLTTLQTSPPCVPRPSVSQSVRVAVTTFSF